jgi:uncharacterized membrane protein
MSEKRSKYDTDPLDPDFVRRAEEEGGPATGRAQPGVGYEDTTRRLDDPTRKFDDATRRSDTPPPAPNPYAPPPPAPNPYAPAEDPLAGSYPSVFVPPVYQPPQQQQGYTSFGAGTGAPPPAHVQPGPSSPYYVRPSSRPVQKLGLGENVANVLPYAPFYIGLIAAIIELVLVPRQETRTRFHAAQGLALHLVIVAATFLFGIIGSITDSRLGGRLFGFAAFIFLVVSMFRVWEGKPHHIAPLDEATRWLNEKFEPRK